MWNVKKSILSLWKARKERLSGEQKKTPKESEKNLQSTARERKFLSSKPSKETDSETEIYEAINRIEFREMPNNWLKMHHKPMRRKGKGKKANE